MPPHLGNTVNEGAITCSSHSINHIRKLSLGIRVSISATIKCPLGKTINEGTITLGYHSVKHISQLSLGIRVSN